MNIGIVIHSYLPELGGAQIQAHGLAHSLKDAGHQVTVVSSHESVRECTRLGWKLEYRLIGIKHASEKLLWLSSKLWKRLLERELLNIAIKYKFDVVQIVMLWPWIVTARRLKSQGIPVYVRASGEDIQIHDQLHYGIRRNKQKDRLIQDSLKHVKGAVAISASVKNEYMLAGMSERDVTVIPPGLDYARFQSTPTNSDCYRRELNISDEKKVIIGVGRNHPKKRFSQLLQCLKILNDEQDRFILIVVGRGSSKLRELACDLGQLPNFIAIEEADTHPTGKIPTLPTVSLIQLYKVADYFVSTSSIETYVNTAIEAMASGVPVIVMDVPGGRDTVSHNRDGLVLELDRPNLLANLIRQLDEEPHTRRALVLNGHKTANSMDWNLVAKQYYEMYIRN